MFGDGIAALSSRRALPFHPTRFLPLPTSPLRTPVAAALEPRLVRRSARGCRLEVKPPTFLARLPDSSSDLQTEIAPSPCAFSATGESANPRGTVFD
jgi:hypothetical protein